MKRIFVAAATLFAALPALEAKAQTPSMHFGSDTRAMSVADCKKRATFALGEQGLKICATTGSESAGCGSNVVALVTCVGLGARTFISVVAASPDGGTAERTRNAVRSLVMGPAN